MIDDIMGGLVCLGLIFMLVSAVTAVYDFFVEVPRQLKRIADKMKSREICYKKGYEKGYDEAMRIIREKEGGV